MAGSSKDGHPSDRGEMVMACPIMEDEDLAKEISEIFGDYAKKVEQYGAGVTDHFPPLCKSTSNVCIG